MKKQHLFTVTALVALMSLGGALALPALAQVAGGTTTVAVAVTESTELAMGWSVKKTLMGKTLYNEAGTKVGKVEDLIVSPARSVSYVIVGAGGFIGMGRHDVAVPVAQITEQGGRLVMQGATKESLKALPTFEYAGDTAQRDRFVAAAERDITAGKARIAVLEKKAGSAEADVKARMVQDIATLQTDVRFAETRVEEMRHAGAVRWHDFEAGVTAAVTKVRKSLDAAST